ncbi:hypothetical protein SAMN05920897_11416 [Alkalispirochaeta americana]|uniref:Uncharacterized protein n=1 Tax=Alkalispirochaeta americana TaxID=159291 RepID=A0A1N6V865_9SPIO|nr:hypothetical protein [Alkalispirochaeta americana]SIQ74035.1 hypothetical protein SAMN05920897_11416 [Alkalispirochaeta americana]
MFSPAGVIKRALAGALFVLVLSSCASTRNTLFIETDEAAQQGDFSRAARIVEENVDTLYGRRDGVLYYLDSGMLLHYADSPAESSQRLSEAERLIEEYFTRSISQAAATFLINDTMRDYAGEDFEDIYLNVFKALNFNALGQTDGALVEARRINIKLNLLEDKYQSLAKGYAQADEAEGPEIQPGESRFYSSALARYLSLVLRRGDGDMDGVRIDWELLQEAFREQSNLYDFPLPFTDEVMQRPDDARISVLVFTGRSPIKVAQTLWVLTRDGAVDIVRAEEDEHLGRVIEGYHSFAFPGVQSGYRFKFELPRMQLRGSEITRIRVMADGRPLGDVQLLENMEQIALDTFQIREPIIFLKTVTRTIIKGIAGQRAGQAMREAGSGSLFGMAAGLAGSIATDIALDASEQADLRISRYFPAYAYAGEWDLPSGEYDIAVEYYRGSSRVHVDQVGTVKVDRNSPNLISSFLIR